jgi:hypothetical protein
VNRARRNDWKSCRMRLFGIEHDAEVSDLEGRVHNDALERERHVSTRRDIADLRWVRGCAVCGVPRNGVPVRGAKCQSKIA